MRSASTPQGFFWKFRSRTRGTTRLCSASTPQGFFWKSTSYFTSTFPVESFDPTRVLLEGACPGVSPRSGPRFDPTRVLLEDVIGESVARLVRASTPQGFFWKRAPRADHHALPAASTPQGFFWKYTIDLVDARERPLRPHKGSSGRRPGSGPTARSSSFDPTRVLLEDHGQRWFPIEGSRFDPTRVLLEVFPNTRSEPFYLMVSHLRFRRPSILVKPRGVDEVHSDHSFFGVELMHSVDTHVQPERTVSLGSQHNESAPFGYRSLFVARVGNGKAEGRKSV